MPVLDAQGEKVFVGGVGERTDDAVRLLRVEVEGEEPEFFALLEIDDQRPVVFLERDHLIDVDVVRGEDLRRFENDAARRALLTVDGHVFQRQRLSVVGDVLQAAEKLAAWPDEKVLRDEIRRGQFHGDLVRRVLAVLHQPGVQVLVGALQLNGVETAVVDRLLFVVGEQTLRLLVAHEQGEITFDVDVQTDLIELDQCADI